LMHHSGRVPIKTAFSAICWMGFWRLGEHHFRGIHLPAISGSCVNNFGQTLSQKAPVQTPHNLQVSAFERRSNLKSPAPSHVRNYGLKNSEESTTPHAANVASSASSLERVSRTWF
jgi:hypothetical protein